MGDSTAIEWADATWNPIVGCSLESPGCTNCYAMPMARRIEAMMASTHYAGTTQVVNGHAVWTGKVVLAPEHILTQPLRWRRGRKIFVNSMGDLFHESVPDEWIDRVFAVMALTPQHTFQVLTKRSARMRGYFETWPMNGHEPDRISDLAHLIAWGRRGYSGLGGICARPMPNVWLGVSTEDQRRADERVPDLLATPAAVRFVSAEPLLGPINFASLCEQRDAAGNVVAWLDVLRGLHFGPDQRTATKLDQIIVGGESGPKARPMHPDWARALRDQCAAAGVPFFFKQWGEWKDGSDFAADAKAVLNDGTICDPTPDDLAALDRASPVPPRHPTMMRRVGKRAAGRLLDGREHNAMPGERP